MSKFRRMLVAAGVVGASLVTHQAGEVSAQSCYRTQPGWYVCSGGYDYPMADAQFMGATNPYGHPATFVLVTTDGYHRGFCLHPGEVHWEDRSVQSVHLAVSPDYWWPEMC